MSSVQSVQMDKIYKSALDTAIQAVEQNDLTHFKKYIHAKNYLVICLDHALRISNTDVIDFLIDESEIDIHRDDLLSPLNILYCHNRVDVIKHFVERYDIFNPNSKRSKYPLIDAAHYDINLDMVKFLINIPNTSIYYTSPYVYSLVAIICRYNTHTDVFEFLDDFFIRNGSDVRFIDHLDSLCSENTNLDIIKYMFEKTRYNNYSVKLPKLYFVCKNEDPNIVKYLVENYDFELTKLDWMEWNDLSRLILLIENCKKLNIIISKGLEIFPLNLSFIAKLINPLKLDKGNLRALHLNDPYEKKYDEFVRMVDKSGTPISCFTETPEELEYAKSHKPKKYTCDYTKRDFLFKHHEMRFYGDREIVYGAIKCLNEMRDICDFSEEISLGDGIVPPIPKYIINMYIQAIYDEEIDISVIKDPNDLIALLKFIDQYPTNELDIDEIGSDIVRYCVKHNIADDGMLSEITNRYQLKELYVYLHNKKINRNQNIIESK